MLPERTPGMKEFLSDGEFTIIPGVFFVEGVLRGAIYDINTGRVYSINHAASKIVKGQTEDTDGFWEKLQSLNLATKEKIKKIKYIPELLQEPKLHFVWFELISDDCNESCAHCYADSMPPSHRKALGLPTGGYIPIENITQESNKAKKLTADEWKKLIDEAYSLGCRRCQFIGGEPMIYKGENGETVLDIAAHAKNLGFEFVEIFTNGTLLTRSKIARMKELGINVAISLYSADPDVHDGITRTLGSHRKTMDALKLLREFVVPTRVETVLMRPNEKTIEETQRFIGDMGFNHRQPDVLRPKGRGGNLNIMPSKETVVRYGLMTSPNFVADRDTISRYISGNSCLLGKITITDNGDVLPCIFSRNFAVGNVVDNSLQEIVRRKKLETIWRSTKDNVLVCQDCEYRYVCFDCRPLSEGMNQGRGEYLTAPYPRCTYNPYTGEWAKGVWRLDENSNPYYDETLKPVIEEVMSKERVESVMPIEH